MARAGQGLDRQRRLGLRASLARPGPLRLPPGGGRGVLQAGRLLGLEVGARQPDALPRHLLGAERRPGQHAHAARDRERAAGAVRRGVRGALAARPSDGRLRGGRRGGVPRLGRVVVRHRGEPRRRRRLVGLVIPAEVPNLVAGEERPPASGAWLEKTRPADGADLCRVARSGSADADAAVAAAREAQVEWGARTAVERGDVVRAIAELLHERREEASEIVAAETGKAIELARGETDAASRWASSSQARDGARTGARRRRRCRIEPC